jgi:hypothetical protein
MADPNERVELDTDSARAGETTGAMRYVLGISLVLIIVIFAVLVLR